jgi:hypothetical protein
MAKTPTQIRSLARTHTEKAVNVLVGIMEQPDAPPAARVAAVNSLLDRGWGKAPQPVVGGEEDDPAISIVTKIEIVPGGDRSA